MTARDGTEAKYKIVEWDEPMPEGSTEIRLYDDGALRNQKGWLIKPHPEGHGEITSDNAGILRARAIEKRQEAVSRNLAQLVSSRSVGNRLIGKAEAWGILASQIGKVIYDGKDSDKINAFRSLAEVTPSKYDKTAQPAAAAAAAPQQVTNIVAVLLQRVARERDIVEGDVVE